MLISIIVFLPFVPFVKAQQLDFAIDLFVPAKNSYNVGETPQLWARVVNTGSVTIDPYELRGYFSVVSPSGATIDAGYGDSTNWIEPGKIDLIENTDNPWTIPSNAEAGLYTIRVTITSMHTSLSRSGQLNNAFSISAPPAADFTLSVSPTSQIITQGQSTTFAVTVNSLSGWTAPVSLSVSGLPSGAASSFSLNPVAPTGTSTLSISTSPSTSTGQFLLVIIGNGDGRQHTTSATLIIQPSQQPEFDFSISASPSSASVESGKGIDVCTVTVNLISGSASRVDLTLSGLPSSVGFHAFSPPYGNPPFTSRLSVATLGNAPTGIYSLTITGSGGGKTRSTAVTLTVTAIPQPEQAPTAYIDSVSPNPAVQGQSVSFSGHGSDPDGYITEYSWRSSIDGYLSSSQSFSTSSLSVGTHAIYFKVKDNEGLWSEDATIVLEITQGPAPPPKPQQGSLKGRVTDASTGNPIGGAAVSVSGPASQTTVTGYDGSFALMVPVGTYTVTVSAPGYESQTKSGTVSHDSTVWLNFELLVARPATVEISIERTENIIAGDTLKAFFRQVIDWIPGTDLPLVDDQILFKVHGSTNVGKLIVRLSSSTSGIAFRTEVEAKKISSDTFLLEVTVGRIYSDEEKKRAVVYFVFELASTFVLQGADLPDNVEKIVEKILDCVEEKAPEGEPLVKVDVFISEVIPVLDDGTKLAPTSFSYRLETVAEGIAKEDANALAKILEQYQKSVGCSASNILIITSSGARVGALFENGIFRNVNEVPGAYYSGFGSHPQLVILPSSAGVYTTQVHATKAGDVCVYIWVKDAQELVLSMSEGEVQTHTVEISSDRVYVDAPWWVPVWDRYGFWLVGLFLIATVMLVFSQTRVGRNLKVSRALKLRRKKDKPKILSVVSRPSIVEVTSAPKILEIKEEE